jgi:hypothetical protein
MDGKDVVAIICHKIIPKDMTLSCAEKVSSLFHNGGYMECSKCKNSSSMVMFGWRYAQEYGR